MADLSGTQIDTKYHLIKRLGVGTFGDVYQGKNIYDDLLVAVKLLKFELTEETLSDFVNEARNMFKLQHVHIVPLLDFGIDKPSKLPFLVMAYAPHGTLRKRHPVGTHVPLETVISYVNPIAAALQYAHDKRVIHRDVKPANILLGDHNTVLLSDFGIAVAAHSDHSLSVQNMSGTLPYMAPEQIQRRPQPASDQYALGIVVYEWLCGERPFQGSEVEIIDQHRSQLPPSLRTKNPTIPPAIEQVVLKALAKLPQERYTSIQAFAQALEDAYKQSLRNYNNEVNNLANAPGSSKLRVNEQASSPPLLAPRPLPPPPHEPDPTPEAPVAAPVPQLSPRPSQQVPIAGGGMRQASGTDVLGANDPRSATIGLIYVAAHTDRKYVLATILMQERFGREQVAIVLPPHPQNKAFQNPSDFDDLKLMRRQLKLRVVFIVPSGLGQAEFARQRGFTVYSSLESYANALRAEVQGEAEKSGPGAKPAGPVMPIRSKSTRPDFANDDDADELGPLSTPIAVEVPKDVPKATQAVPMPRSTGAPDIDDAPVIELRSGRSRPTLPLPPRKPDHVPETPVVAPAPSRPSRTGPQLPPAGFVARGAVAGTAAANVIAPIRNPPGRTTPTTGAGMSPLTSRPGRFGGQPPHSTPPGRGGHGGGGRRPVNRRGLLLVGLIVLVLALLLCGGLVFAQPTNPVSGSIRAVFGLPSSSTVSITPNSKPISDTYTLTSADKTDPAARTVAVRSIAGTAQSAAVQVNATGHNVTAATQAHGFITFFNGVAVAQQVNAGMRIPVSGGVTLVTDEIASIPAGNPPNSFGQKTVAAHSEPAGPAGNVGAMVLNGVACCTAGVSVSNTTAFTGGTDAANYTFLRQNDVTNAITQQTLDTTKQDALSNLSKQLHTGEQPFGATQCNPVISSDQLLGDNGAAKQVNTANVTYRMKCTATAYDYAGAQTVASGLLAQKAATTLPAGYAAVSNIQVSLINQTTANNTTSFSFSAKGLWAYQFSDQQKQNIVRSIVSKSVAEAEAILRNTPGVGKATITIGSGNSLPADPNQLSIQVQPLTTGSTVVTGVPTAPPLGQPTVAAPVVQGGGGTGAK